MWNRIKLSLDEEALNEIIIESSDYNVNIISIFSSTTKTILLNKMSWMRF